jgi:ABC-type polysaccharide/polyol phosphate export permease
MAAAGRRTLGRDRTPAAPEALMAYELRLESDSAATVSRPRTAREPDIKGLLWTLVRTDVKVYYHGTIAGFIWALLRPLSMFVALALVFAMVFASQPNFVINLLIGLFIYEFFSEGTKAGLVSLYAKGYLLSKTRFPYWIVVPISSVNAIIILLIFSSTLLVYMGLAGILPAPLHVALYGAYMLLMWCIILGLALLMSALYLRFRDLNHIWDAVVQAGFFVAPIIVTLDMLPAHIHRYLFLWPPTPVIVYSRRVLVEGVTPSLNENLYLMGIAATCLLVGVVAFRRLARNAAEQL